MSDDRPPPNQPPPPPWAREMIDTQKRMVKAVTNLALGLDSAAKLDEQRHDQLVGMLLADVAEKRSERKRHDSGDYTDKFKLPGGNKLELTRHTQHAIVRALIRYGWIVLVFVGTHLIHYFLAKAAIQEATQKQPTPIAVPVRAPELPTPSLQPPPLPPVRPCRPSAAASDSRSSSGD